MRDYVISGTRYMYIDIAGEVCSKCKHCTRRRGPRGIEYHCDIDDHLQRDMEVVCMKCDSWEERVDVQTGINR